MDLFAVLAEVEGTGVPLAYCLVELLKPPQAQSGGDENRPCGSGSDDVHYSAISATPEVFRVQSKMRRD